MHSVERIPDSHKATLHGSADRHFDPLAVAELTVYYRVSAVEAF